MGLYRYFDPASKTAPGAGPPPGVGCCTPHGHALRITVGIPIIIRGVPDTTAVRRATEGALPLPAAKKDH
ncbi:MAG: hypothetical protein GY820_21840 [Gammaproteobacteria bacterium]|nr:hypothetical protein [Gammaproteobacteria bacterium]